jgi:hypothetical protein
MLEKVDKELSSVFVDAGVDDAIDKINKALEASGQSFRVDSVSFTEEAEAKNCRCTRRGVTGYTERCVIRNGQRSCTRVPTYGCTNWDCT